MSVCLHREWNTPSPSHNTSPYTGSMYFLGGTPSSLLGWGVPVTRTGWGSPSSWTVWGTPVGDWMGLPLPPIWKWMAPGQVMPRAGRHSSCFGASNDVRPGLQSQHQIIFSYFFKQKNCYSNLCTLSSDT